MASRCDPAASSLGPLLPPATLAASLSLPLQPAGVPLTGSWVTLLPYDEALHLSALRAVQDGSPCWGHGAYDWDADLWRFLLSRAFSGGVPAADCYDSQGRLSQDAFARQQRARSSPGDRRTWLVLLHERTELPPVFARGAGVEGELSAGSDAASVRERPSAACSLRVVGQVSLMSNRPADLVCEIGLVAITPALQRTPVLTETAALLIGHLARLGYRRCEWKCNALHTRSQAAALRLGFQHEGVFRNHMIVHDGISRDTWWSALDPQEWQEGEAGARVRAWLAGDEALALFVRRAEELRARA